MLKSSRFQILKLEKTIMRWWVFLSRKRSIPLLLLILEDSLLIPSCAHATPLLKSLPYWSRLFVEFVRTSWTFPASWNFWIKDCQRGFRIYVDNKEIGLTSKKPGKWVTYLVRLSLFYVIWCIVEQRLRVRYNVLLVLMFNNACCREDADHQSVVGEQQLLPCLTWLQTGQWVFFSFLWSTRVFPFAPTYSSICDEEIRPT